MNWLSILKAAQELIHLGVSITGELSHSHKDQVSAGHVQDVSDATIEAVTKLAELLPKK